MQLSSQTSHFQNNWHNNNQQNSYSNWHTLFAKGANYAKAFTINSKNKYCPKKHNLQPCMNYNNHYRIDNKIQHRATAPIPPSENKLTIPTQNIYIIAIEGELSFNLSPHVCCSVWETAARLRVGWSKLSTVQEEEWLQSQWFDVIAQVLFVDNFFLST